MIAKKLVLILAVLVLCAPVIAFAAEGQPFQALQKQIDQLQQQINNIKLTPGPPGPSGTFDVTKVYTEYCRGEFQCSCSHTPNDILLSGGIGCETTTASTCSVDISIPVCVGGVTCDSAGYAPPTGWAGVCSCYSYTGELLMPQLQTGTIWIVCYTP